MADYISSTKNQDGSTTYYKAGGDYWTEAAGGKVIGSMKGGVGTGIYEAYSYTPTQTTSTQSKISSTPTNISTSSDTTKGGSSTQITGTGTKLTGTGTTYTTVSGTQATKSDIAKSVTDTWNSMSYQQQQAAIQKNPQIQNYLTQAGLTTKRQDADVSTATQFNVQEREPGTKPQKGEQGWDYQATDDARTQEIINNLDWYKVNQPNLFSDYDTFKSMFIDGKGRSEGQIKVLNDYFFGQQKLQEYMMYTPDQLAMGYLNGTIGNDIFQAIALQDPQKYAEIQAAITNQKNGIYNQATYESMIGQSGLETGFEAYKKYLGYKDEDQNGIDDLLEIKQSPEELAVLDEINSLTSEIEQYTVAKRKMMDDLKEKYPDASLSTLMIMANDRSADLTDMIQDKSLALTKLQGTAQIYEQQRKDAIQARKDTLNELNTMYGMYYKYTPQGISEMAQFEYAATNKTLDQADRGTYTEKQMALESVLSPIYEQYGDIIQRSQAQVVNDVIAYAQNNGVTLSEALEQNFMSKLRDKPAYKAIQEQQTTVKGNWSLEPIKNAKGEIVGYQKLNKDTGETLPFSGYTYNPDTGTFDDTYQIGQGQDLTNRNTRQGIMRETAISSGTLENAVNAIADGLEGSMVYGDKGCGYYVNDALYALEGVKGPFPSEISGKRALCKEGLAGADIGDSIVFDWNITKPKFAVDGGLLGYGHVGMITGSYSDGSLDISSVVNGKVVTKNIKPGDDWYNNIYGYRKTNAKLGAEAYGYGQHPMSEVMTKAITKIPDANARSDAKFANAAYGTLYDLANSYDKNGVSDLEYLLKQSDIQRMLLNSKAKVFSKDKTTSDEIMNYVKTNVSDQRALRAVNKLMSFIESKLRQESGAAISSTEWTSNFYQFFPQAGEDYYTSYEKFANFERNKLVPEMNVALAYLDGGYSYLPIFERGLEAAKATSTSDSLNVSTKGTWNIGGGTIASTPTTNQYDSLFNSLGL